MIVEAATISLSGTTFSEELNDHRNYVSAKLQRLRAVAGDAGCHSCHTHMSCTERCPKHLSPTASIAGLKKEILKMTLRGEFDPQK